MKPVDFTYHRATGVEDALERLAARGEGARLIGGGQSLGPMLNLRLSRPRVLVDISSVEALRGIESTRESVVAGAAATHSEIEDQPVSDPIERALHEVAAGIAYRAVRNRGTIGGSIVHADPAADWTSFLLCADARIYIRRVGGEREVRMCDFTRAAYTTALAPDEIVTRIEIPRTTERARFGFHKLCRKTGGAGGGDRSGTRRSRAALLPSGRRRGRREAGGAAGRDAVPRRHRRAGRPRSAADRDRGPYRRARSGEAAHGGGRGGPRRRPGAGDTVRGEHGRGGDRTRTLCGRHRSDTQDGYHRDPGTPGHGASARLPARHGTSRERENGARMTTVRLVELPGSGKLISR